MSSNQGIDFADPVDMLLYLDDDLLAGRYELYPWQIKILTDFARTSTQQDPFQAVVRACNGSGKDKMIVAPCAVWLAMRHPDTTCVVTSASGTQLDRQTNTYIHKLATSANAKIDPSLWVTNYRHYSCNFPKTSTGDEVNSTIELFVTDESGRAEGWHPKGHNTHLGIFTSEAKSIPDEIFNALARCTGFTKRVDVSTPGLPMGHFFNRCTGEGWNKYHITAYECPHISKQYIEQCRLDYGGESSALFKSMVLAEFGTTDDLVVIPYHQIYKCIYENTTPWFSEAHNHAGLDLSAGGDETVLVVRNGNKVVAVVGFRYDDTTKTVDHLERLFKEYRLDNPKSLIYGDAGGLGKPILDELKNRRGWYNIRYVLNQAKPGDGIVYYNRGAELWFKFGTHIESREILLSGDERLKRQLSTRYYKQTDGNKLLLESKLQAKSKGHPSPDRADACVLAFTGYRSKLVDEPIVEWPLPEKKKQEPAQPPFTLREHANRQSGGADEFSKYYETRKGEHKQVNLDHLQSLIKEHNDRIRNQKQKEEVVIS